MAQAPALDDSIGISAKRLRRALDAVARTDKAIARAIKHHGYPPPRQRLGGMETMVRVIIGQQVSVASASAIHARMEQAVDGDMRAERILALSDDDLKTVGLSRQKMAYVRSLAEAVATGALDFDALWQLDDADAIAAITQVKGLGLWSAQMYLISTLGRGDIWPVLDVGVQEGIARILQLDTRPKPKELEAIGAKWQPYRSAVALLAWHFLSAEPL